MDMNSGAVLCAKKAEEKRYPASITKVLSVLTALQYAKMSDTVVFSEDSISFLQWDDADRDEARGRNQHGVSTLWDASGSANEVSLCGGGKCRKQYLNGGYAEFIEEMNRISQELGCTSSNWVNAMEASMMTTTIQQRMIWRELQRQLIRMKSFEDWRQRWNTKSSTRRIWTGGRKGFWIRIIKNALGRKTIITMRMRKRERPIYRSVKDNACDDGGRK